MYFVSIFQNLTYTDETDSPVIIGITNGFIVINNKGSHVFSLTDIVIKWVFDSVIDIPKAPVNSNTCRN